MPHKTAAERAAYQRSYRKAHPDTRDRTAERAVYYQAHRSKMIRQSQVAYWKSKYGVTPEWYDETLAVQDGLCAICKRPERMTFKGKIKRLCIDHDHETGKARKLLCHECNTHLGWVERIGLTAVTDYLIA
jgi:transposase